MRKRQTVEDLILYGKEGELSRMWLVPIFVLGLGFALGAIFVLVRFIKFVLHFWGIA